jgi:hypothetical protein
VVRVGGEFAGNGSSGACASADGAAGIGEPSIVGSEAADSGDWTGFGVALTEPACWGRLSGFGANRQQSALSVDAVVEDGAPVMQEGHAARAATRGIEQVAPFAAGIAVEGTPTNAMRRMATNRFKVLAPIVRDAREPFTAPPYPLYPAARILRRAADLINLSSSARSSPSSTILTE